MSKEQTVIYAAGTMQEAYLLKDVLAEAGIEAVVTNEVLEGGSGVDVVGWVTLARVVVAEEDAEVARRIALYFDGAKHDLPDDIMEETKVADDPTYEPGRGEEQDATIDVWPRCPRCGSPRPTRCPICGTLGTDFQQADLDFVGTLEDSEPEDGQSNEPEEPVDELGDIEAPGLVLMCPTCDEPFAPEFPNRCAWCDHEFDDGFEVDHFDDQPPEEVGSRVMAVVFCLMCLLLALLAYFVLLVR